MSGGLRALPHPEPARLAPWVARWRGCPVVVWGDFVLDEYWRCRSSRVSREAPVLVLDWERREAQPGGAANAALNLAAMGATVAVAGLLGDDAAGEELRRALAARGIDTAGLIAIPGAHTVVKVRVTAGSAHTARQQVVRIDRGAPFAPPRPVAAALARSLQRAAQGARAILLSDYGYDTVTPALAAPRVRRWTARGITVALDSRFRLARYRGVTLATPNESEAAAAAAAEIADERDLARVAPRLRRALAARHLIVTRGRDGLTLWDARERLSFAAWGGHEAVDVTGAGDAVVAAATLALAAGAPPVLAAALANVAGSVAVSRRGAVAVSGADLERAIGRPRRRLAARAEAEAPRGAGSRRAGAPGVAPGRGDSHGESAGRARPARAGGWGAGPAPRPARTRARSGEPPR